MSIEETLEERGKVHGDFVANAIYAQQLRAVFRRSPRWPHLSEVNREALDQVAGKLARVLAAPNPSRVDPDHWHDVAGYATLAEREARKESLTLAEREAHKESG